MCIKIGPLGTLNWAFWPWQKQEVRLYYQYMKTVKLSTSVVLIMACALTLHAQKIKVPAGATQKAPAVTSQLSKSTALRSGILYGTFFPIPSFVSNWFKKWRNPAVEAPVVTPAPVPAQTTEQLLEDLNNAALERHQAQVSTQQRLDDELDEIENELLAQDLESDLQRSITEQRQAQANLSKQLDAELDQAEADLLAGKIPLETAVERTAAKQIMQKEQPAAPQYKFLTGIDALDEYAYGWEYEILSNGYGDDIVRHVRDAFKKTQQTLFETDEQGNWVKPRHRTFQLYSDWFYKVLGSKVDDPNRLINTVRHSELFRPVIALMDLQSFVAFYGRLPVDPGTVEYEKTVLYYMEKYNVQMHTVAPKQAPQVQAKRRTTVSQKNPKEASAEPRPNAPLTQNRQKLDEFKRWVQEHQRWPLSSDKAEKSMYYWSYTLMREKPNDPVSIELEELKKQYIQARTPRKTAQEWLDIIEPWVLEHQRWPSPTVEEEKQMYEGARTIFRKNADDDVTLKLKELWKQYGPTPDTRKTPQEWLEIVELWVLEHGRWPSPMVEEEKALYDGAKHTMSRWANDPAGIRLKELKEQYTSDTPVPASSQVTTKRAVLETALEQSIANRVLKAQQSAEPSTFEKWGLVTGRQALGQYASGWKYELQAKKFATAQIARVEKAFQETDKVLFETNDQGHWQKPGTLTWQSYTEWYKKILTSDGPRYTAIQQGILFGPNSMFKPVFARLDVQSFVVFYGRMPSLQATDGAERAMAEQAQAMNINLAPLPEDVLKKRLSSLQKPTPIQPQAQTTPLPQAQPNVPVVVSRNPKTPQEWLVVIEPWVQEHQRWPSGSIEAEKSLYMNTYFAMRNHPDDPASVRMKELKEQYNNSKTSQEWLEIIESWVLEHQRWPSRSVEAEKEMNNAASHIIYYKSDDPASVRLKELREQYGTTREKRKTPQEWLEVIEPWVVEHGRWPYANRPDEKKMNKGAWSAVQNNPDDPASIRLQELKDQYAQRQIAEPKSSQKWLEMIEPWVLEHQRWPSQAVEEEKQMYVNINAIISRNPNDPASIRLKELRTKYSTSRKTPQQWLDIIESWVLEHQRWPSQYVEEEKQMYHGALSVMKNHPDAPESIRLQELKEQYK